MQKIRGFGGDGHGDLFNLFLQIKSYKNTMCVYDGRFTVTGRTGLGEKKSDLLKLIVC